MADPVLPAHHVRIAKALYEELKAKMTLGTVNAVVVRHDDTEGVHIHMYLKHDEPCTSKTAKLRFKAAYGITRGLTNGDWSWSDPKTLEGFWAYTMSGYKTGKRKHHFDNMARTGASCIVWGIEEPRLPDFPERPDVPVVSTMNVVQLHIPKQSKLPLKEQFLRHCMAKFEGSHEHVTKDQVLREFIRWSKYGYTDYQIIPCVRYVYYSMNDTDEMRELVENSAIENIISKI